MKEIDAHATPPNNLFNPTLASGAFIIKLRGFCYLVCGALAPGGLIRALGRASGR
jgi:hypothetical protein